MKIAFINGPGENLGLEYIAAVLKANGHQVRLFVDNRFFDDEYISVKWLSRVFSADKRILTELKHYKPDLIGISVMTLFYPWACRMAKMIKQDMAVPIIFGGIHPTSAPEQVINNDFVDMICVGEGEYPMLDLVNSIDQGAVDYSIKNIWFKKNGQIIRNEVRPFVENMDEMLFADKPLFYSKYKHYQEVYYIMASRGCCFSCSYCCHSYLKNLYKNKGKYFRLRSVNNVIKELKYAKKNYNSKYVVFFDDNFGVNESWLKDFSVQYEKFIALPFSCYMHPLHINDKKAEYLRNAAYCEVQTGVQNFNHKINNQIFNRQYPIETVQQAIDSLKKFKIRYRVDNIVGVGAEETEKDWLEMAEFHNKNRPDGINLYWLNFFPNTQVTEWARRNNVLTESDHEKIVNGIGYASFLTDANINKREFTKLYLFVPFILKLPKWLVSFILKKRLYRVLPEIKGSIWGAVDVVLGRYLRKHNGESLTSNFRMLGRLDYFLRKVRKK
jgi:anaerobic magnesium-protoporphyrin IX monomethyl ester cyclase